MLKHLGWAFEIPRILEASCSAEGQTRSTRDESDCEPSVGMVIQAGDPMVLGNMFCVEDAESPGMDLVHGVGAWISHEADPPFSGLNPLRK